MNSLFYTCFTLLLSTALSATSFKVTYSLPEEKPIYTPRVYIALVPLHSASSPKAQMVNFINLPTLFSVDDLDQDGEVTIDRNSLSTNPIEDLKGTFKVQAIVKINPDWWMAGHGIGDLYSNVKHIDFSTNKRNVITFKANNVQPSPKFRSTGNTQDHFFKSEKLSQFHGREYNMRYSIILPKEWDKNKKYPVIVNVLGFTGVHHETTKYTQQLFGSKGRSVIIVIPDANCRWGHSVFANSLTNGPWGDALTHELLPHIDKTYGGAGPEHRYITGVSSGGWAAAWAIVNYPNAYAAAWSVAPDPVDFEMFQEINLKDNKKDNLYLTTDKKKNTERHVTVPGIHFPYKKLATFEHVLGPGGQLQSFAAVFTSKVDKDKNPEQWYDVKSGEININTTSNWIDYDISEVMKKNWSTLEPKLKGKMHFGIHQTDIFHLHHAIRLLEKDCKKIGSDATFTYFPGRGHHMISSYADKMMKSVLSKWNKENTHPAK